MHTTHSQRFLYAGVAHVSGIILCIIRIILSRQSKGAEKYRLNSTARFVHVCAAIAAAANLLLVLFLLNGRIAADTILVVHGHVAPFEWVGECSTNAMHCFKPMYKSACSCSVSAQNSCVQQCCYLHPPAWWAWSVLLSRMSCVPSLVCNFCEVSSSYYSACEKQPGPDHVLIQSMREVTSAKSSSIQHVAPTTQKVHSWA